MSTSFSLAFRPLASAAPAEVAVRLEGVAKAYQVYRRPTDQLRQLLLGSRTRRYYEEYWALREVGFTVARGESVGIVGRNGSGKTTLLQLVCGITEPSRGTVETQGRVAPVLALGSAFDYELTGRENAYLTGAILGLKRAEVTARLDAIAALCGLGEFFDRPVKLYSSGMASRLAFAITAHADGDILIVDEALAVGDDSFRQRCSAHIAGFRRCGTLLVVSHDLGDIERLCERTIWIDRGLVRQDGPTRSVLDAYARALAEEPDDPNRFRFEP